MMWGGRSPARLTVSPEPPHPDLTPTPASLHPTELKLQLTVEHHCLVCRSVLFLMTRHFDSGQYLSRLTGSDAQSGSSSLHVFLGLFQSNSDLLPRTL